MLGEKPDRKENGLMNRWQPGKWTLTNDLRICTWNVLTHYKLRALKKRRIGKSQLRWSVGGHKDIEIGELVVSCQR